MSNESNTTRESRGVVFLNVNGTRFHERLAVAAFTLRRWWSGPILMLCDEGTEEITGRIAADKNVGATTKKVVPFTGCRHSGYITKTFVPQWVQEFDRVLLIDADTVTVGPFEEIWEPDLSVTHFCGWISTGRTMSGRIKRWLNLSPAINRLVAIQLEKPWPALNTGVLQWKRGFAPMAVWHAITVASAGRHMSDEISMQVLMGALPESSYRVFPPKYNASPIYSPDVENPRVWHHHGDKKLRPGKSREIWEPSFREAWNADVGGLRGWAGQYDGNVKALLAG